MSPGLPLLPFLFVGASNLLLISGLPHQVRIGGIFEDDHRGRASEAAFRFAVDRINSRGKILPQTLLSYHIFYVPRDNSFVATKKVCSLVRMGIAALFGPNDLMLGFHVQSIVSTLEIPHISSRWELEPSFHGDSGEAMPRHHSTSINLYPSYSVLNQAFADAVEHWRWTSMVILYEDQFGLVKLQNLLKTQSTSTHEVFIQQVHNQDYRRALQSIKEMQIYNVILDIADEYLPVLLRNILQLQMNDFRYHYLFTTFNMELLDLEDFRYNYVNMTGFRLIKRDEAAFKDIEPDLTRYYNQMPLGPFAMDHANETYGLTADAALIYDAVHVFAECLASIGDSTEVHVANLSCDDPSESASPDGGTLQNYLNSANYGGLTGQIRFTKGQRDDFELDVIRLTMRNHQQRFIQIGTWDSTNKTRIVDQWFSASDESRDKARNITLIVATILEKPYMMWKDDKENRTGNDRFKGFLVDLIERIAAKAGFNYTFVPRDDNQYGVPKDGSDPSNPEWHGLVGDLLRKKADLAVAALTITYQREQVIDFTKPFMNLGLSILFKIPKATPSLFSFMKPLSTEIWIYVLCASALVALELFVIARFSPYEWYNPHPCNAHHDVLENQFTLSNTIWFSIGTLMQQGSDVYPKAISTRIVGGIWWFFTLIIISSYTANLAAFLTVERMVSPIDGAEDLARNKESINYGVVRGGSSFQFFKDAKIPMYKDMFTWMEKNHHLSYVNNYDEGIARVEAGNYAFIMESTMIEYVSAHNCNLTQIGGLLDSKGYGIGLPKGSPWRDKLSLIILNLQEAGIISELKDIWWRGSKDCKKNDRKKENVANALDVDNFGGAFVVLIVGQVVAVITAVLEFIWNSRKNAHVDKQSLCSEMAEELRFAIRCRGSRQKPTLRRQCSQCSPEFTTYVPTDFEFAGIDMRRSRSAGYENGKKRPLRNGHSHAIDLA